MDRPVPPTAEILAPAFQQLEEPWMVTTAELDQPGPMIVAVNPALCAITGYSADELVGQNPRILQGPETDRAVLDELRRACTAGQPFTGEALNYRKDGSTYFVEWSISPVRDAAGTITHFIAVQRDVTAERRRRDQINAEARAALTAVTEQAALLAEAVLVLEKTKRSFRSTELGRLRARLQAAIAKTTPGRSTSS